MALSLNDLQQIKSTLKRAPPPKAPMGPPTPQNGADTSALSVASVRERFEQKRTPPPKVHAGSSPRQDNSEPSEENVLSVASARAKFEQKQKLANKSLPSWKQSVWKPSKTGSQSLDENSNPSSHGNMEPPRKELPTFFRIGAAPRKPAKPDHLKPMLRKYQDKIILSNGVSTSVQAYIEGRLETIIYNCVFNPST